MVRRFIVLVLTAALVASLGSAVVARSHQPATDTSLSGVSDVHLIVDPHAKLLVHDKVFVMRLDKPEAGRTYKSSPVSFTVTTNDNVQIRISEDFTAGLKERFNLSDDDLKALLGPRLQIGLVHSTSSRPAVNSLLEPVPTLNIVGEGTYTYEMHILLSWNPTTDWWRITPTDARIGSIYITVESASDR